MSDRGDSTRDWLLKKLLKAKESLIEQAREIRSLTAGVARTRQEANDWRDRTEQAVASAGRLAERVDELEFENQQLKRVPPIAPNLEVIYHTQRGVSYPTLVRAVQHAAGHTTIHVQWHDPTSRRARDAEAVEFID